MKYVVISIILLLIIAFGCNNNTSINSTDKSGKVDLIIEHISYTRLSNVGQDPYVVTIGASSLFEFDLIIKNIGTKDLRSSIFIENSRSKRDFDSSYCSHGQLVNYPPVNIPAQGSIETKVTDIIYDSVYNVLFIIDSNDRYHRGDPIPLIDESNYDNNTFVLQMTW
jgi:hypothetical protein